MASVSSMTPEPAKPAESPEARALRAILFEVAALKAFDFEIRDIAGPTNWQALMNALDDGRATLAATTARPTERGAVEVTAALLGEVMQDAWGEICDDAGAHPSDMQHGRGSVLFYSPGHWTDLIALRLSERLALPATDQAAEVERVEFIARVLWADGQRRLNQGQSDLPRPRTDFRTAARAVLDHPALATQPATGRTMGGEDGLREAIRLALQCTPYVAMGAEQYEVGYDCGDPWEILRAALQNGGE